MLHTSLLNLLKYMPIMAFQGLQAGRDHALRSSPPPGPGKRSALASARSSTQAETKKNATNTRAGGAVA